MENSRNKQLINFKLCAVLSSVMKTHTVPLHPTLDVNHPFVQHILPVSHFVAIRLTLALVTLILLNSPKHESSDAGNSDMLERSH